MRSQPVWMTPPSAPTPPPSPRPSRRPIRAGGGGADGSGQCGAVRRTGVGTARGTISASEWFCVRRPGRGLVVAAVTARRSTAQQVCDEACASLAAKIDQLRPRRAAGCRKTVAAQALTEDVCSFHPARLHAPPCPTGQEVTPWSARRTAPTAQRVRLGARRQPLGAVLALDSQCRGRDRRSGYGGDRAAEGYREHHRCAGACPDPLRAAGPSGQCAQCEPMPVGNTETAMNLSSTLPRRRH